MEDQNPISRVFEAAGCRTQAELADFLGIRQSSISDAKRRNTIPPEWLITLLRLKKINPDWVLTGRGAQYLKPATKDSAPHTVYVTKVRPPQSCIDQELITELVRRALVRV